MSTHIKTLKRVKEQFEIDQHGSSSIKFDTIQLVAISVNKDSLIVPSLYRLVL